MKKTARADTALTLAALVATLFGLFAIWDSGYARAAANGQLLPREFIYQAVIAVVSVAVGLWIGKFDSAKLRKFAKVGLVVSFVLLVMVELPVIGKEINGAKRWIGFGPFTIQPAEFAKVTCILFLAAALAGRAEWKQPRVRDWFEWMDKVFVPKLKRAWPLLCVLGVAVMIELEPDLATASVIVLTTGMMLYLGRVSKKSLLTLSTVVIVVLGLLILKEPYRLARLSNHGDRWSEANIESIGYQTTQSEMAFASGGMIGVGLGEGRAKHTLPAPTTDFVLATVGEEFGLIGSLFVIGLLGFITWRLYAASLRREETFGRLVLGGTATWIAVQTVVNVTMVNGHLTAIGVPLPFFSYGGSSLLAMWAAIGLCQAVNASPEVVKEAAEPKGRESAKFATRQEPVRERVALR